MLFRGTFDYLVRGGTKKILKDRNLSLEWQAKMSEKVDCSKKNILTLQPRTPQQPNFSDRGLFFLHYVEKIFSSVISFYWPETVKSLNENWFSLHEVLKLVHEGDFY